MPPIARHSLPSHESHSWLFRIRQLRSTVMILGLLILAGSFFGVDPALAAINFLGLQDCIGIGTVRLDWSSDLGPPYVSNFPTPASCATFANVNQTLAVTRYLSPGYGCSGTANIQISPAGAYSGTPVIVLDYDLIADHTTNDGYGLGSSTFWKVFPQFSGITGSTMVYYRIVIDVLVHNPSSPLIVQQDGHGNIFTGTANGSYSITGSAPYNQMFFRVSSDAGKCSQCPGYAESRNRVSFSFDLAPVAAVDGPGPAEPGNAPQLAAFPNPAGAQAELRFNLPRPMATSLDIFDSVGRPIRHLDNSAVQEGSRSILWDGRDDRGLFLPSGVYFARLAWTGGSVTTHVTLIR